MKLQNQFRATCHAIGDIMTEPRKEDKTQFSKTCLNHIYAWLKKQPEFYGRRKSIQSKYFDKGLYCEPESIEFAARVYKWGLVEKNTERKYLDFLEGECDVLLKLSVEDIKNSWDENTFPLFDMALTEARYWWQLQGYMHLYDRPKGGIVYTLIDAPEWLIEREARKKMYELGLSELPEELYQEFEEKMTFGHLPEFLRIKRFEILRDTLCMGKVYDRVMNIRRFIDSLPDIQTFINLHCDALIE